MFLLRKLHGLSEFVLPRNCVFCGTPSQDDEKSICVGCLGDLPWIESSQRLLAAPFEHAEVPLSYDFPIDVAIKALKFNRKLFYARPLAEILCSACTQLPGDIDALLPVPLHWRRKARRGFNQAMEIGKPVARHLGLPLVRGVYRRHATPFQSGLSASERSRNLRHAFACRGNISYKHVLIVDDVITTGATTTQLAQLLLQHDVERVSVLAVARATRIRRRRSD